MASTSRRYTATVDVDKTGRVLVPVPFDPDEFWGAKPRHHVAGTVNGCPMRAVLEPVGNRWRFVLGPAWQRGSTVTGDGEQVTVEVHPEGPQRADLADDVAAALAAEPEAGAFFDSLAQFYRKAYLRWVDATKRRPDLRAARIAEMVDLLKAGHKERPRDC